MQISIPDHLNEWVQAQAAEAGLPRAADFVAALLERERILSKQGDDGFLRSAMADEGVDPDAIPEPDVARRKREVELRLLEGLAGPAGPMTAGDWRRLRLAAAGTP